VAFLILQKQSYTTIRDQLVHPKAIEHIIPANDEMFTLLIGCHESYEDFMTKIMTKFFISTTIKNF